MKYRWAFLIWLVFLIGIHGKVIGQTGASSIAVIRGYVLCQYEKQEIQNKFLSRGNSIPIDRYSRAYFLPFGSTILDSAVNSLNNLDRGNIVFLPSKETNELIKEFSKKNVDLIKDNSPKLTGDSTYFEIPTQSDKKYLYKFYFIECLAIKVTIENTAKNAFRLNIPFNNKSADLNCNFVCDTTILQPIHIINSKRIKRYQTAQLIHESQHLLPKQ